MNNEPTKCWRCKKNVDPLDQLDHSLTYYSATGKNFKLSVCFECISDIHSMCDSEYDDCLAEYSTNINIPKPR